MTPRPPPLPYPTYAGVRQERFESGVLAVQAGRGGSLQEHHLYRLQQHLRRGGSCLQPACVVACGLRKPPRVSAETCIAHITECPPGLSNSPPSKQAPDGRVRFNATTVACWLALISLPIICFCVFQEISGLVFQAAVPKSFTMKMGALSGHQLPPHRCVDSGKEAGAERFRGIFVKNDIFCLRRCREFFVRKPGAPCHLVSRPAVSVLLFVP